VRILVIEDEKQLAEAVRRGLVAESFSVDVSHDGQDGLWRATEGTYDAIVLDVMLPGIDGLTVCRKVREEARRETPILMLTARDTLEDKITGLDAGADDYLVKPFELRELEARLRSMVRRHRGATARELHTIGDLTLDLATLKVTRAGRALSLTPIGIRLLTVLARASPRVVSRHDLEREVWGDVPPDSDALRSHLYNLRKAIDRPFDRPLLHTVAPAGYRLADDADS
jgi:DNA-binding response OmpR family regulator